MGLENINPHIKGKMVMDAHKKEVVQGKRFEFGKNWQRFLSILNVDRILGAQGL